MAVAGIECHEPGGDAGFALHHVERASGAWAASRRSAAVMTKSNVTSWFLSVDRRDRRVDGQRHDQLEVRLLDDEVRARARHRGARPDRQACELSARPQYPSILDIHGGPNGQDQHAFQFRPRAAGGQRLRRQLAINYRGSAGRGGACQKAIHGDWGTLEVVDLLGAVDEAVRQGVADPDRLGIGGWISAASPPTTPSPVTRDSRPR